MTKLKLFNNSIFSVLFLAFIIGTLYFQTTKYGYTALDDYDLIKKKISFLSNWNNLPIIFRTTLFQSEGTVYFRPIVTLSFMIDVLLFKGFVFGFHFSSLVYHFIATCLIYFGLNKILNSHWFALALSSIFAVHSLNVQAISWIPGRNDILLLIFMLLTLHFFIKTNYSEQIVKTLFYSFLFFLFFFLGLLTKENFLIIILMFLVFSVVNKKNIKSKIPLVLLFSGMVILVIIYFKLRQNAINSSLQYEVFNLKVKDYLIGILSYTSKIFFPLDLNVLSLAESVNLVYVGFGILIFVIFLSFGIKDIKIFTISIGFYFLFLISGMVGTTGFANFLEHRAYVPLVFMLLVMGQLKLFDRLNQSQIFILFTFLFFTFSIISFNYSNNFKDELTFWREAVRKNSNSYFAHRGLANTYHYKNMFEQAEREYLKSLELNPKSLETIINLATNYKKLEKFENAEELFKKSLRINNNPIIYNNFGNLLLAMGKNEEAIQYFQKAIQLKPNYFEAYSNLGVAYAKLSQASLAKEYFLKSIQINPFFAEGHYNLAIAFSSLNKLDSAQIHLNEAQKLGIKISVNNKAN